MATFSQRCPIIVQFSSTYDFFGFFKVFLKNFIIPKMSVNGKKFDSILKQLQGLLYGKSVLGIEKLALGIKRSRDLIDKSPTLPILLDRAFYFNTAMSDTIFANLNFIPKLKKDRCPSLPISRVALLKPFLESVSLCISKSCPKLRRR